MLAGSSLAPGRALAVPASSFGGDPSFRGVGMPARRSSGVRFVFVKCTLSFGEAYRSVSLGVGGEFA